MTNIQHTNATREFGREKQTKLKPSRRQDVLIKKKSRQKLMKQNQRRRYKNQ